MAKQLVVEDDVWYGLGSCPLWAVGVVDTYGYDFGFSYGYGCGLGFVSFVPKENNPCPFHGRRLKSWKTNVWYG